MHSDGWQAHWFQHCLIFHTDSGALLLGTERRLCSPTCRLKPTCLTPVLPSRQQTCCLAFCSLNYGWMLKIHFGTRWGLGPWKNPKASPQGSQCCRAAGGRGHEQQQWLQSSWGLSALQGSQRPGSSLLLETNTNIHSSTLLFENRVSIQAETKQTEPTLLWLDLVILVVSSNLNNSVALQNVTLCSRVMPQPAAASWDGDSIAECCEDKRGGGKKLRGLPLWEEKENEATRTAQQTQREAAAGLGTLEEHTYSYLQYTGFYICCLRIPNSMICFTTGWLVRELLAQSIFPNKSAISNSETVPQHTATSRALLEATESIWQQGNTKHLVLFQSASVKALDFDIIIFRLFTY